MRISYYGIHVNSGGTFFFKTQFAFPFLYPGSSLDIVEKNVQPETYCEEDNP